MAVLLAVALFSVIFANGLSASPQHSRYLGLDLLLAFDEFALFEPLVAEFEPLFDDFLVKCGTP